MVCSLVLPVFPHPRGSLLCICFFPLADDLMTSSWPPGSGVSSVIATVTAEILGALAMRASVHSINRIWGKKHPVLQDSEDRCSEYLACENFPFFFFFYYPQYKVFVFVFRIMAVASFGFSFSF